MLSRWLTLLNVSCVLWDIPKYMNLRNDQLQTNFVNVAKSMFEEKDKLTLDVLTCAVTLMPVNEAVATV